jgi:hypothetical protein
LAATSNVWTNTLGGDWSVASNWDPNAVPNASDVTITNNGIYTITNNSSVTVAQLDFDSPFTTLAGTGDLTINNLFTWQSGSLGGRGTVASRDGMHLAGAGLKTLSAKNLVNVAAATWSEDSVITVSDGAVLSNLASATFDCAGDGTIENGPGTNRFDNAGLLRKTGGTNTTRINVPFNNSGTVEVQSGTLVVNNGGTNTGTYVVPANATLTFSGSGTHTFADSSVITGAGNLNVDAPGGTVNLGGLVNVTGSHTFSAGTVNLTGNYNYDGNDLVINSGTVNLNGSGTVALASLTVGTFGFLGGSNLVTVSGPINWGTSSTIMGGNNIIANGPLLISAGVTLSGRTLVNTTTALWSNSVPASLQYRHGRYPIGRCEFHEWLVHTA